MSRNTALLSAGAFIIVPRKGDDQNEVHSRLTKTRKPGWGARLGSLLVLPLHTFFVRPGGWAPALHTGHRNTNQKLRWNSKLRFHKIENNPASNQDSKF